MPPKNVTKRPQHVIEEAVKRYMAGEQVSVLSKYYKVSKPGFYLWVAKHKQAMLDKASTQAMTPKDAAIADKRTLLIEVEQLRQENRKLRDKLLTEMMKAGTI